MTDTHDSTIECPSCAETIKAQAAKCRFCGHELKATEEKVYLEKPVLVTSKMVKIPWRNKYQPDRTIRVQDIESVNHKVNGRGYFLWMAAIAVLGIPSCTTVLGNGGKVTFLITMGIAAVFAGIPAVIYAFSQHKSNVEIKSKAGVTWFSGKSLDDGNRVKNAINQAIEESA